MIRIFNIKSKQFLVIGELIIIIFLFSTAFDMIFALKYQTCVILTEVFFLCVCIYFVSGSMVSLITMACSFLINSSRRYYKYLEVFMFSKLKYYSHFRRFIHHSKDFFIWSSHCPSFGCGEGRAHLQVINHANQLQY